MFRFEDIERAVLTAGFEFRNATGSHHIYLDKKTGISVTVPKHPKGVSIGVSQSVLRTCVLVARVNEINIGSYKNKLTNEIYSYIESHHAKCKENLLFLIPEEHRQVNKIENAEDVRKYLSSFKQNYDFYTKKYNQKNQEQTFAY